MNRFHWHTSNRFTEEDLIAYHLGELAPQRARKLELALAADATLAAESAAILETLSAFRRDEAGPVISASDLDRYWLALRPHIPVHVAAHAPIHSWVKPLLVAGGAAAIMTVGIMMIAHHPERQPVESYMSAAPKPALGYPQQSQNGGAGAEIASGQQPFRSFPKGAAAPPVVRSPIEGAPGVDSLKRPPSLAATAPPPQDPSRSEALEMAASPVPSQPSSESSVSVPGKTAALPGKTHHGSHTSWSEDLTLGVFGNVIAGHSYNAAATGNTGEDYHAVGATPAVGALASFHQQFSPMVGYRVTGAYSRPSLDYTYRPASTPNAQPSSIEITTRAVELSGAYVIQGPHGHRIHTEAEAGGGVLMFHPYQSDTTPTTVVRPAGIAGIGAEFEVTKRVSVHAQYRAVIFETPDFHTTNAAVPITSSVVVSSQPSVGITFHLGKSPSN